MEGLIKIMANAIDMTGWIMSEHGVPDSKLIVIEQGPSHNDRHARWWCKCTCNLNKQPFLVKSTNIRKGITKSCGCIQQKQRKQNGLNRKGIPLNTYIDMTGWKMKQHGVPDSIITVLYKTDKTICGQTVWHCIDEQGFEADIKSHSIRSGAALSCGGIGCSKGQYKIAKLLKENNISFKREVMFDNLKDKLPLRFDFYINNEYLIQYDGQQHFKRSGDNSHWNDLTYNQKHDKMKNEYCISHNIPLIRIPYTRFNDLNINDLLLSTSSFRIN